MQQIGMLRFLKVTLLPNMFTTNLGLEIFIVTFFYYFKLEYIGRSSVQNSIYIEPFLSHNDHVRGA